MIDLGEIKACMARNGHKQKDIATILDLSENSVNQKIQGKREFTVHELSILAKTYDVDINLFIK
jgi:plasmid maintenance system antidote protein VapI